MSEKEIFELINEGAKAATVQRHQQKQVEDRLVELQDIVEEVEQLNSANSQKLDDLLAEAERLCLDMGEDPYSITDEEIECGLEYIQLTEEESQAIVQKELPELEVISGVDGDWTAYLETVERYAAQHDIDLSKDPFDNLMTASEKAEIAKRIKEDYTAQKCHCDKYDYIIAGFCGVISGLIDSLFVGCPGDSKLQPWTDAQADNFVHKFASGIYKADQQKREKLLNQGLSKSEVRDKLEGIGIPGDISKKEPDTLQKSIQYLEKRFKVNYDSTNASMLKDAQGKLGHMSPKNHHLKSLGHAPDLIGLLFSLLDQFTGKATFVDDGKIVRLEPNERNGEFQLIGNTFGQKLFFGFSNWLGHLISDYVGSNSARSEVIDGKAMGRGSGLVIPFFEMFQFCKFGDINVNGVRMDIADLSVKIYERGYDFRFGQTMAIPVVLNEICIRLLWSIKSHFYHGKAWKESVPFGNHPELRRMLLVGHGACCMIDAIDAGIRTVSVIDFALRMNIVAWSKFSMAALREVRIYFKDNCLDIDAMEMDLEQEWTRLLNAF